MRQARGVDRLGHGGPLSRLLEQCYPNDAANEHHHHQHHDNDTTFALEPYLLRWLSQCLSENLLVSREDYSSQR